MGKSLDFSDQFPWSWKESREQPNTTNPFSKSVKWYLHLIGGHMWSGGLNDLCRITGWIVGSDALSTTPLLFSEQLCSGNLRWIASFFVFVSLINLLIYLFLAVLVFVSVRGLSLVVASGGHSSLRCVGLSLLRPLFVAEHRLQTRRLSSCGSRA